MSIDYAHTRTAAGQRAAKAQTLARWCYGHGILDASLLEVDPQLRRRIARAAAVSPPHEVEGQAGETWHLVVELLRRKLEWDRQHQVVSPPPATCMECAVLEDWCSRHQPRSCTVCGGRLHQVLLEEGATTHPSCDLLHLNDRVLPAPASSAEPEGEDATLY